MATGKLFTRSNSVRFLSSLSLVERARQQGTPRRRGLFCPLAPLPVLGTWRREQTIQGRAGPWEPKDEDTVLLGWGGERGDHPEERTRVSLWMQRRRGMFRFVPSRLKQN